MEETGGSKQEQLLREIHDRLDTLDKKTTLILEKLEIEYPPAEEGHPGMSEGKGTL
jgi:hypothetical protein